MTNLPENSDVAEGLRLLQASDAPGAIASLERAAAHYPTDATAFQYLGVARTQVGDLPGGIAALRRASELRPDDAGIWFNLGIALNQAERNDDARAALEHALTLDPTHGKARLALGALPGAPSAIAPGRIPMPPPSPAPTLTPGNRTGYGTPGAFAPATRGGVAVRGAEPDLGLRIRRGLGWGMVYGQYWTLLNTFWYIFWNASRGTVFLYHILITAIVFTIVGSVTGLVAAVTNAKGNLGAILGIIAGMLLFAAETFFLNPTPFNVINVFFWFVTGRFVGNHIAAKIQARTQG